MTRSADGRPEPAAFFIHADGNRMAGDTGHAGFGHRGGSGRNAGQFAFPNDFRESMQRTMTGGAAIGTALCRIHLPTMTNRDVTIQAFDFMLGHMLLMDEYKILVALDVLDFGMTGTAAFGRHESVTGNRLHMAGNAVHVARENGRMVERRIGGGDSGGRNVTMRAAGEIRRMAVRVGLQMAEKASAFRNGNMLSLNDRRMT